MAARKRTSKKFSAASSRHRREAERLASLVFFVDRSLGKHIVAQALRAAGARVEVHDDHFPQDATDVEWLTCAGTRDTSRDRSSIPFPVEAASRDRYSFPVAPGAAQPGGEREPDAAQLGDRVLHPRV